MPSLDELLVQLNDLHGVSGNEGQVASFINKQLEPIADDFYSDSLGNQVYIKKGENQEYGLMLAAHMDEIGFVVNFIDDSGFVYILPVGIHDSRMAINQLLTIQTDKGPVTGITGSKPAHIVSPEESQKAIPLDQLHVNVGTTSKEETLKLGVRVGDYVSFDRKGQFINGSKVFTGKAVDNRAGCAVLIELMKRIKNEKTYPNIYAVATVQEEIGIRGAGPVATFLKPNIALAIDVTFAGGTPGICSKELPIQLGKGPAIKYFDWSLNTFNGNAVPKILNRRLVEVAKKYSIPYQREVMLHGATDASKISLSGEGVLSGGISLPSHYIHSATGCVHLDDMENAIKLIKAFIESLSEVTF